MKYIAVSFLILVLGFTGIFTPLKDLVGGVISPIQFGLRATAFNIKHTFNFFADSNKVRNENLFLLDKVVSLEEEVATLKIVSNENLLLRQQLGIDTISEKPYSLLLARVMGNPSDLTNSSMLVDKGSKHGVRVNDMVVVGKYLVGIVRNVSYNNSTFELITSSNVSLTAYDIDSPQKTAGLLKGAHGSVLSLERILPNEKIEVGDTIVTSGKEGIFLPNLIVGKVIDVQNDPSQPLKKATIQSSLDINKFIEVFIIKNE